MNEPVNDDRLQAWYESTLAELRTVVPVDFPLYIGDAWDPDWYAKWTGERTDSVVMDHHVYRCFTAADHKLTGEQHAQMMKTQTKTFFGELSGKANGNWVIGEWSAALNPGIIEMQLTERRKDKRSAETPWNVVAVHPKGQFPEL